MEMIYGALGAVFVLLLIALGFCLGWTAAAHFDRSRRADKPDKDELQSVRDARDALQTLQSYNADVAYGVRSLDGGDSA